MPALAGASVHIRNRILLTFRCNCPRHAIVYCPSLVSERFVRAVDFTKLVYVKTDFIVEESFRRQRSNQPSSVPPS